MDRLHGLRLPDSTACGRDGRLLTLGDGKAIVQGDRAFRIAASRHAIDCRQCLARIARHGLAFEWADVPPHPASVAKEQRRRHRRGRRK